LSFSWVAWSRAHALDGARRARSRHTGSCNGARHRARAVLWPPPTGGAGPPLTILLENHSCTNITDIRQKNDYNPGMNKKTKFHIWYVFIAVWGILLFHSLWVQSLQTEQIPYSQFETYLKEGRVAEIRIGSNYIEGKLKDPAEGQPQQFVTVRVDPELAE